MVFFNRLSIRFISFSIFLREWSVCWSIFLIGSRIVLIWAVSFCPSRQQVNNVLLLSVRFSCSLGHLMQQFEMQFIYNSKQAGLRLGSRKVTSTQQQEALGLSRFGNTASWHQSGKSMEILMILSILALSLLVVAKLILDNYFRLIYKQKSPCLIRVFSSVEYERFPQ